VYGTTKSKKKQRYVFVGINYENFDFEGENIEVYRKQTSTASLKNTKGKIFKQKNYLRRKNGPVIFQYGQV